MLVKFLSILILSGIITVKAQSQNALAIASPEHSANSGSAGTPLSVYEFRVYVNESDLSAVSDDLLEPHPFGNLVSRKLYLIKSKYTHEVPVIPGNPQTKTVIRKPAIYEAVTRIEHYLKKSVRKGNLSNEAAAITFNKVLDVALNAFAADSDNFEKTISKTDDLVSLITLFTNRVNLVL